MSVTFQSLIATLDQLDIRHYPDPANESTLLPYRTAGLDLLVVVRLECEGDFVSLQSTMPEQWPDDLGLARLVAEQNAVVRLVQIGLKDRHVSASAGLWVMDAKVTPTLLGRYLHNFVGASSKAFAEIRQAASGRGPYSTSIHETGKAA
jgi:hypothetical protein